MQHVVEADVSIKAAAGGCMPRMLGGTYDTTTCLAGAFTDTVTVSDASVAQVD